MALRRLMLVLAMALGAAVSTTPAEASPEGPRLSISVAERRAALTCSPGLAEAGRAPVLLTPAFSTADASYGWNYLARLPRIGIPTCSITVPDSGYGDLQTTAEQVVSAVRWMHRTSGRKVVLLGHQHGALDELWALKFWPDVARRTSDLISLATPYAGTSSSAPLCGSGLGCAAATRQISAGSRYIDALGDAPLPRGPAITSIASLDDTLVTPQPAASRLEGAVNVQVQDVCPGRRVSHFDILADAVAYRLVIDAIERTGPADPASVPASACSERLMPDSDPLIAAAANGFLPIFLAQNAAAAVPAEPAVRPYAARAAADLRLLTRSARPTGGDRIPLRISCESIGRWNCDLRMQVRAGGEVVGRRRLRVRAGSPRTVRPVLDLGGVAAGRRVLSVRIRGTDTLGNDASVNASIRLLGS